jgi:hypothetical protein
MGLHQPMVLRTDPRLVALFGSTARVRTLAVLASAFRPMTGYRIGRTASVPLPKVYRELKRLRSAGLVAQLPGGWVLSDDDVGSFLRKRLRLAWATDWFGEIERRAPEDRAILGRLRTLGAPGFPRRWTPRDPGQPRRNPRKDRLLSQMGLATSKHGDSAGI